jgi:hypothetical protein
MANSFLQCGGSLIPELSNQFSCEKVYSAAVDLCMDMEFRYILEEAKYLNYPTSSSGTGNYSAAVVSVQGTGIPLQSGGSQVSEVV